MAEPQEAKPWSDLEDAIADFWASFPDMKLHCKNLVDERFPESFLDKFVTNVEAAAWSIYDDPRCEVPKRLMESLFQDEKREMIKIADGEIKPLTPIEEAIAELWENFRNQGNRDLKSFLNHRKDERFPDGFLSEFTKLLDEKWDPSVDKDSKVPKRLMESLFQDENKMKKFADGDIKPWAPIEEAIAELWGSFRTQGNKDLKSFVNLLKDEPFPDGFLSEFTVLLDKQWDPSLDNDYQRAEGIMASHFRSLKEKIKKKHRNKEGRKRAAEAKRAEAEKQAAEEKHAEAEKRAAEEKRAEAEKRAAEEKRAEAEKRAAEEKHAEEIIPVLTEQQLEKNRALKKKDIDRRKGEYLVKQGVERKAANEARDIQKTADRCKQTRNMFKNCQKFEDEDEDVV